MLLKQIKAIAEQKLEMLSPHCERIAIAGSIRRRKAFPNDIEIVAIPKAYNVGLFESGIATIVNRWQKIKGELPCKYTQRVLPEGVKLDLFFATPTNWGLIFAIRTGSAEFSHKVLATHWVKLGYHSQDGQLMRDGNIIPLIEEKDLFDLLQLNWVDPWDRQ